MAYGFVWISSGLIYAAFFCCALIFCQRARVGTPQSSCGLPLTWCASQEPGPLFSLQKLTAIHSEPVPISPVAPVPFCGVKPAILFGSVGLPAELFPSRLMTRSLRLLDPTSPHVTALACAQHVTAGAHL